MGYSLGRIVKTELGKPYCTDAPNCFFSLSHTAGYAVCAMGDTPCGVDIEGERVISLRIRKRFLDGASEQEAVLRWTMRESYGKLEGRGFFAGEPPREARFVTYRTLAGFVVTVCVLDGAEVSPIMEAL